MTGTSTTSSFQKKIKPKIVSIQGTKPSIQNSQLLTSTGIPSFDSLLGGGLPVGSILVIEEDFFDVYSKLFMKCYLSEGIVNGHFVFLASMNEKPVNIFNNLPALNSKIDSSSTSEQNNEKLKIAWRYQEKEPSLLSMKSDIQNSYDITKVLDINNVTDTISSWDGISTSSTICSKFSNPLYQSLLSNINAKINEHNLLPNQAKVKSNLLRIAIHSLSSPLWGEEYSKMEKDEKWADVTSFLILLRALIRSSFSVTMITVPSHLFSDPTLVSRITNITDFVIKLESFQGSEKETNPLFQEYHGLLHVKKFPLINTMIPCQLDSNDWAFNLKRKTLSLQKLHLPPELSDTPSRTQETQSKQNLCMSKKSLDF